jgi:hypothetical protein
MATCFVIQPFDTGKFDKRFEQVFKPAIIAAGLEPYRVDEDPRVEVPIEAIEKGIRSASVCLADITTDNPNVWYELGYAMAAGTPVVMVCSTERQERDGKKYPFDIQHRTVVSYKADAPDDFYTLGESITARIKASLARGETLLQLGQTDQVAPVAGLSMEELTVLAVTAGAVGLPKGEASLYSIQRDAGKASLTKIGFVLGLRRLSVKAFVETTELADWNGNTSPGLKITDRGWNWIDANPTKFILRRGEERFQDIEITDEDIPF